MRYRKKMSEVIHSCGLIQLNVPSSVASYAYVALRHVPPRLPTVSFLFHFGVNLTANYPNVFLDTQ